jgi:hypothetical protein
MRRGNRKEGKWARKKKERQMKSNYSRRNATRPK